MILIQNLSKTYNVGEKKLEVLKKINIQIHQGELVSIVGKSGSGKSTLLNILGMLDRFDNGDYIFNNTSIKNFTETELSHFRNKSIGFVFQSFHLLPHKTALDNVILPLIYQNNTKKERIQKASDILDKVGLSDRIHHLPNQLSGGQKQRIAIARALVTQPKLILADEPTGALDSNTSKEILQLLKSINNNGTTVIIVTHDNDIANQCNKKIIIKDGKIQD